ncbi:glucan endo-1,3-beta-glucosidase 12-like isoform X2 [Ananas comosus]|uniref:Glucan endo-1,3-beta-glucosidase 12-like isoform X2 n=1 Tax=Ananas comosus TaxID=4615 RepID=A0A6P5FIL7_ANACO|nr:glucan endo-1,3-beta-glucosidase 12-like isoform X2 [Ananas comosus]
MLLMEFSYLYLIFSLAPLVTLTGEEITKLVNPHEQSTFHESPPPHAKYPLPITAILNESELFVVSSSVLGAENWLKTHVVPLLHYPAIPAIVVGKGVLCNGNHEHQWGLVLPSLENLYFSLVRWGLVPNIEVHVSVSSDCFRRSVSIRDVLHPLLRFLRDSDLAHLIDPPQSALVRDTARMREAKPKKRVLLSSLSFPSNPINRKSPSPIQFAPVPDSSFSFVPSASPSEIPLGPTPSPFTSPAIPPTSPLISPAIPPALVHNPRRTPHVHRTKPPVKAPTASAFPPSPSLCPHNGEAHTMRLWCVAKPTVPTDKLQEAMDYACGEGGADCEEIRRGGHCYYPDTVAAHASYAFNSYWQMAKYEGGSCSFGDTAIVVTTDPSYGRCRFLIA